MSAQYVLGIDLGTTNSVLAYCKIEEDGPQVRLLEIPQVVDSGVVESHDSLASFLYQGTDEEKAAGSFTLPWGRRNMPSGW